MARVSVVLPSANSREALLATVGSILNQSYRDFELLITDDGSTDGTGLELLTRWGPDPSRAELVWRDSLREDTGTRSIQMLHGGTLIHYLHQVSARGSGAARNRAINLATGELLSFSEPGDLWRPRKLSLQVDLMDAHPDLGACVENHAPKKAKKAASRKRPVLSPVQFEDILECPGLRLSGALVRRACLGCETFFDENLPVCEEYDFGLRLASRHPVGRLVETLQTTGSRPEYREWGLERFRVYALEKAYQGGHLTPTVRYRVAEELVRQCDQLVEGYRERDNQERANFYDRKKKRFAQEVAKLDVSDPIFSRDRTGRRTLSGAPV